MQYREALNALLEQDYNTVISERDYEIANNNRLVERLKNVQQIINKREEVINKQKSEIERLTQECSNLAQDLDHLAARLTEK